VTRKNSEEDAPEVFQETLTVGQVGFAVESNCKNCDLTFPVAQSSGEQIVCPACGTANDPDSVVLICADNF
jgi:hypothetical protein